MAKNFADMGEKRGENLAKCFANFRPSISMKSGRKKFHEKSTTHSTSHETKLFHSETLGAWGHKKLCCDSKSLHLRSCKLSIQGVVLPLTEKWDPLELGTEEKIERFTEAEIKHGRVAMLATLGYFVPYEFHFPGCETFDNGMGAISTLPALGWVQIIALIGAHEALIKPREGGVGPWDFGFGTEIFDTLPSEDEKLRWRAESCHNAGSGMPQGLFL